MATTKKGFVLAAFLASALAAVCSVVALATDEWVTASPALEDDSVRDNSEDSYVRYGLFSGFMRLYSGLPGSYELEMVCSFKNNVCAQLCELDSGKTWLETALDDNNDVSANCQQITSNEFYGVRRQISFRKNENKERKFINAGVWLCTILFLIMSIVVGAASSGLALWNTFNSPIDAYLGIFGLYIYNGVAWGFTILAICLWGGHYAATLIYDIAIEYTISGDFTSDKRASLGYSYWLNLVPLFLYPASIALLYIRDYLNARDPGQKNIHLEDSADPAIYLY